VVTVTFTSSLALSSPQVSILGHATTTAINTGGMTWAASTTVSAADTQGNAAFFISAPNILQTGTTTASAITSGSDVIVDTIAPVISIHGSNPDSVITDSTGYTDPGANALDAHDGSVSVITSGNVNRAVPGTYVLTYSATDSAGNIANASRTVSVTSPPAGGSIAGLIGTTGVYMGFGYVAPRPQIIYPDGHIVYLDSATDSPESENQRIATSSANSGDASIVSGRLYIMGDKGGIIHDLQVFLNNHGYPLANSGPGSSGEETMFFGRLTRNALVAFQKAQGLPASGNYGPLTRAMISSILGNSGT